MDTYIELTIADHCESRFAIANYEIVSFHCTLDRNLSRAPKSLHCPCRVRQETAVAEYQS